MPLKKIRQRHSASAVLHMKELKKSGSSLELEIYASREKIGTLILARLTRFEHRSTSFH